MIDDTVCSEAYVAMRQSNLVWGWSLGIMMQWMFRSENGEWRDAQGPGYLE
jgi:hypothetical protein